MEEWTGAMQRVAPVLLVDGGDMSGGVLWVLRLWISRWIPVVLPRASEDASEALRVFDGLVDDAVKVFTRPQLQREYSQKTLQKVDEVMSSGDALAIVDMLLDAAGPGADGSATAGPGGAVAAMAGDLELQQRRVFLAREAMFAVLSEVMAPTAQAAGQRSEDAGAVEANALLAAVREWVGTGLVAGRNTGDAAEIADYLRQQARGGNAPVFRLSVIAMLLAPLVGVIAVQGIPPAVRKTLRAQPNLSAKRVHKAMLDVLRERALGTA